MLSTNAKATWRAYRHSGAAICLGVFGADNFMIPSLVAMLVMFILLRPYLDDLKIDKTDGENETNNADKETNA